jgi:hypothetical protein
MLGNAPDYVRDQERFNNQAADKHATTVKDALDELDHRIHPSLGACPHFKSCWEQVTHVRSLLPNLRPIRKEDQDKLSSRLNELCDSLKHLQDDYWLERSTISNRVREYVLNDLQSARHSAEGARDAHGLREAEEKIERIRRTLLGRDRDSWGAQLLKEARDVCWEAYRQAREDMHLCRARMQDLAYSQLRGPVAAAEADAGRDNPFEVFSRIKRLQRDVCEANLSKDQREDLKSTLRGAWEKASARADEHKQKKREKLGSTETMFEEIIERKRETIRKLEATIHDLRCKEIWSDEYGERVAGWILEREHRISDIEHQISQLEGKLADVRDRLGRL